MTTTPNQYEYSYQNSQAGYHHGYLLKPLIEIMSEMLPPNNNQKPRILDIGCGNGSLSNFLAQQGYEVVSVEESESGVKLANQTFPNCRFIQGSIYDLPYSELGDNFDIVIAVEVIEHLSVYNVV
ncbi:MAG: class I SAM-dependent methyltransferase [Dolichospermum sp.]